MIKASFNQLTNVKNPYQGTDRKVLCVCSAGLLRSPTMAKILGESYKYNTRSCGISEEYALIPISEALIHWADEIVFAETRHKKHVEALISLEGKEVKCLDIRDEYEYCNKKLIECIIEAYEAW